MGSLMVVLLGISNDDIKKREWLGVRSTNSLWGSGPPFPSPVYVDAVLNPGGERFSSFFTHRVFTLF